MIPPLTWLDDPGEILLALRTPPPPRTPAPELDYLRLRHAWRIARAKASLNNWIEPAALLETMHQEEDPLDTYWAVPPTRPRVLAYDSQDSMLAEVDPTTPLLPIPDIRGTFASNQILRAALTRQAILPPPAPDPDPDHEDRWYKATLMICERLCLIDDPRVEDPNTGNLLPTPSGCSWQAALELLESQDAWPTPAEIVAFEYEMVDMAVATLVQRGRERAGKFFVTCFRFTRTETTELLQMARARARDMTMADVEEKRALMELMLEDLAQRCKKNHDLRAELGTYKALAVVQGIARAEVEDDAEIFAKVVKRAPPIGNTTPQSRQLVIPQNPRLEPIDDGDDN